MGRPLYTNNAATYLAFGITNTATTMQVSANAGSLFPSPTNGDYFYVSLISLSGPIIEIVKCTARVGDVFTIERGQEGTSAQYWNMGDNVQLRITAAGMNFITGASAVTTEEQVFTATQGQTVFTLTNFDYTPGTNSLAVFVNGSKQVTGVNYTETSINVVTLTSGANAGDVVEIVAGLGVANGTLYATDVKYNEGGTGAVTRTVEAKLQESVSVKDFGAVGDGATDDTTAIQNAINSFSAEGGVVRLPVGNYKTTATITVPKMVSLIGDVEGTWNGTSYDDGVVITPAFSGDVIVMNGTANHASNNVFENICIIANKNVYTSGNGFVLNNAISVIFRRCCVLNIAGNGFVTGDNPSNSYHNYFYNCYCLGAGGSGYQVQSAWVRIIDSWADTCQIGVNFPSANGGDFGHIVRCHFEEHEQAAIKISGAVGRQGAHIIDSCYIASRRYVLGDPGYGIWFDTSTNASGTNGCIVQNNELVCQTNYVANTNTHGIELGTGALGNTFINNTISSFYVNINLNGGNDYGIFNHNYINGYNGNQSVVLNSSNIVWEANEFTNSAGSYSISGSGIVNTFIGNYFDKPPNVSLLSPTTCNNGYGSGTFTPSFTGLTVVNGTGGATYSGKYRIEGSMLFWRVEIAVTGTCTTSSAGGGATYFSGLPVSTTGLEVCVASSGNVQNYGTGVVSVITAYLPAWSAVNQPIVISGNYSLA